MAGKPITRGSRRLAHALDSLSKNTLADIVLDLIQGQIGDGSSDEEIAAALQPTVDTVCRLRAGKPPNLAALMERLDRSDAAYRARMMT